VKKFSEFQIGEEFFSTCVISKKELDSYLNFSRVKNVLIENSKSTIISGRAILSRMEGEFTRLNEIYGNSIILYGSDGDVNWKNRNTRFLKPFHIDEELKIKFTISGKEELDDGFGQLAIDYEGINQNGEIVVISKKNLYRIKKESTKNLESH